MEPNKSAIERAFELAQTGRFLEVAEIKDQLRKEGYFTESITGPTLHGQLMHLIEAGKKARWEAPSSGCCSAGAAAAAKASRAMARRRTTAHA